MHLGRMTCSAAVAAIAAALVHHGELTRSPGWSAMAEARFQPAANPNAVGQGEETGKFMFLIDAIRISQSGKKAQDTLGAGSRTCCKIKKGFRGNDSKVGRKHVPSFTCGLLITAPGIRMPLQIPRRTKDCRAEHGFEHMSTAETAAEMIRALPVDEDAEVVVLGDTAYESKGVETVCAEKGCPRGFPANLERVYEGPTGQRPKLRSRRKDRTSLSLKTTRP